MFSTLAGFQQIPGPANTGPTDDHFNQVVLLAHCNGADLSTTFFDSSSFHRALTAAANAKISTGQSKFGGSSGLFDGNADQVTSAASADFNLSGDFTIEGFVRFSTVVGAQFFFALQQTSFDGTKTIWIEFNANVANKMSCYLFGSYVVSLNTINAGQWYYVAVKRSGTTGSFWIDGVQQGASISASVPGSSKVAIGGSDGISAANQYLNGNMDEWRITNGFARDVSSTPVAEFPNFGGTVPNPVAKCNPPGSISTPFDVVALPTLFAITGAPTGTVTLATVTSTDNAMTAVVMDEHGDIANIPGLTFSYAAKVLTVAGTPTGHSKIYSIGACYRSSDGTGRAVGATLHDITIANAADVLTIGSMNAASIKVGVPSTTVLLSPSSNYPTGLKAIAATNVPGMSVVLAWSTGATPSGTVSLTGTPTIAGSYALNIDYYTPDCTVKLGASTHVVNVAESYVTPPAPPAPSAGPTPPTPSPPPTPTPAPQPGRGPDPFFTSVKALLHFNDAANVASDQISQNAWTNDQVSYVPGAILGGGGFASSSKLSCAIAGAEGLSGLLTVELMFDIDSASWDALTAAGTDFRWCPISSLMAQDGTCLWAVGLFSYYSPFLKGRETRAGFYMPQLSVPGDSTVIQPFGAIIPARPGKFMHLAGAINPRPGGGGYDHVGCVWLNGDPGLGSALFLASRRVTKAGFMVSIGGADTSIKAYFGGQSSIIPFAGKIDEYRLTAEARYAAYMGSTAYAIPSSARSIPWSDS